MDLKDLERLFQKKGIGVMGTADGEGWVNLAIYSPPIITSEGTLVFGATQRLTYKNLTENPRAMFMYVSPEDWDGVRIRMSLVKDETSGEFLETLKERFLAIGYTTLAREIRHALHFKVEEVRPLKEGPPCKE